MTLTRMELSGGLVVYRATRLAEAGIVHGFSTRLNGLGGHEAELLTRVLTPSCSAGLCVRACRARQVHGNVVYVADGESPDSAHVENLPIADAIVTATPGVAATVVTADCLPILLSAEGGAVAAIHAGWRGLLAGVIAAAVGTMIQRFGAGPERMLAAIGPAICAEHFEVGEEVAAAFTQAGLSDAVLVRRPRPHIDLRLAAVRHLRHCGVQAEQIEVIDRCTYCHAEEFHSYRRDGKAAGRQVSMIVA